VNKKFKIKTGDTVIIIAGKDKGKTGNVSSVLKANDRVIVEGVNIVKRHRKATQESPGKIEEKEASIHISNVAHVDPESGKATRIKYEVKDGVKRRLSVISGALLDK
jgi:large subunit ribosomal protein L24